MRRAIWPRRFSIDLANGGEEYIVPNGSWVQTRHLGAQNARPTLKPIVIPCNVKGDEGMRILFGEKRLIACLPKEFPEKFGNVLRAFVPK